jgi:hypothetical protein
MKNFLSGILHDANDANALKYNHGMLQLYPPYKNLDPEIPR